MTWIQFSVSTPFISSDTSCRDPLIQRREAEFGTIVRGGLENAESFPREKCKAITLAGKREKSLGCDPESKLRLEGRQMIIEGGSLRMGCNNYTTIKDERSNIMLAPCSQDELGGMQQLRRRQRL